MRRLRVGDTSRVSTGVHMCRSLHHMVPKPTYVEKERFLEETVATLTPSIFPGKRVKRKGEPACPVKFHGLRRLCHRSLLNRAE
jgi:hypothetical protein